MRNPRAGHVFGSGIAALVVLLMALSKSRASLFDLASCANGAPGLANAEGTLLISGKTGRLKVCLQTFLQLKFNALSTR